jgi:Arc/MetJ-type ribon-helix-helix transcriptional regulator
MNTRIGIRITKKMREEIDAEVKAGHYKNISELVCIAVHQLLKIATEKTVGA